MSKQPKRSHRRPPTDEAPSPAAGGPARPFRSDRPTGPRPLTRGEAGGAPPGGGRGGYRTGGKKPRFQGPSPSRGRKPGPHGRRPKPGAPQGPPPVREHPQYGRNIPPEELEILEQIRQERSVHLESRAPRGYRPGGGPPASPVPRPAGRPEQPGGRHFRAKRHPHRVGVQRAGEGPPRPAPLPEESALGKLRRILYGYQSSAAILAAHSLGLFQEIHQKPQVAADLARHCHADPVGVERLLGVLVGLGVVHLHGSTYVLPREYAALLAPGVDGDATGLVEQAADLYAAYGQLAHGVRTGAPLYRLSSDALLAGDLERVRRYIRAVHTGGREAARRVVSMAPLPPQSSLLDVAGGSGIYAAEYARRVPGLSAVLFDLPPTIEIAREILAAEGLEDLVTFRAGDHRHDPLPGPVDSILLSNVLQTESVEGARAVLAKAREALRPGGTLLVHGTMTNRAGTEPPEAALFSLHMYVVFDHGRAYSADEIAEWLAESGFGVRSTRPLGAPFISTLIQATRLE